MTNEKQGLKAGVGQSGRAGKWGRGWALLGLGVGLGWGVAGCEGDVGRAAGGGGETAREVKTVADYFEIRVGERVVRMQLAVTMAEMQQGLMGRRDLGEDDGMLFVYRQPQGMSFWMRNTPTPLDIGFFTADGVLREIYPLHPFDERPVEARRGDLLLALEVNRGWFQRAGVKPGAQLDLAGVRRGLEERGFDPGRFALE